jgi:hypothetical protein
MATSEVLKAIEAAEKEALMDAQVHKHPPEERF